jgi:hypothetical protein
LIPPTAPAFALMMKRTNWKLLYRDRDSALFGRASSSAARIAGAPISHQADSRSYFP